MGYHSIEDILSWQGSPAAKAVLVAMAFRNNDKTNRCDPSIPGLAEMTCLSRRTVIRALTELEAAGKIFPIRHPGKRSSYGMNRCHGDTGDKESPVPKTSKPVPNLHGTSAKSAKTSATVTPEQKKRKEKENTRSSPSPWRGEASRLLERVTKTCKPAFDDEQFLRAAAEGDELAWRRFQRSTEGATRRFRKETA